MLFRPVKDTVVTNDRWGDDAMCKHGGFLTCDDRYTPSAYAHSIDHSIDWQIEYSKHFSSRIGNVLTILAHLLKRKWEDCLTIDAASWGYRRDMAMSEILSIETLISTLASTVAYVYCVVLYAISFLNILWKKGEISAPWEYFFPRNFISSYGGNMLLNVGPTADGTIPPIFEERLLQMGAWLAVNGEGIYGSDIWTAQNDTITPNIWYGKLFLVA